MVSRTWRRGTHPLLLAAAVCVVAAATLAAQQGRGGQPPQSPQAASPIDITGYWVAIVTEDWRWRMLTANKGDFSSVPLNPEGQKVANAWDPATDGSCKAFGAAGLMRQPTRLHITWENATTIRIDTDAGQQTRRLMFGATQPPGASRSLQGFSVAQWERYTGRGARTEGPGAGSLKVVTTNMTAGWLRRNGVPYSENAVLTEHFDRFPAPNGEEWLVVTSVVTDPTYLTTDFVTSSHFRREPNGSKWEPAPCKP